MSSQIHHTKPHQATPGDFYSPGDVRFGFGRYVGELVRHVMQIDPGYCTYIYKEPWMPKRWPLEYNAIRIFAHVFSVPLSDPDALHDHSAMVAKTVETSTVSALLQNLPLQLPPDASPLVKIEEERQDVVIRVGSLTVVVEVKPSLGVEISEVLDQMYRARRYKIGRLAANVGYLHVLLIGCYTGRLSREALVSLFHQNDICLLFLGDLVPIAA